MLGFLDSIFDRLEEISTSPWFYLVIFVIALLDSVVPIVPSETTVILGGIAAGQGHLNLAIVIAAGWLGAMIGDNLAYSIGHRFRVPVQRWYDKKPERAKKLSWAEHQLRTRGGSLLITARFVPGGRTVVTVSSGITGQSRPRFMFWVAIACLIWASYGAGLGYFFGTQIKDSHTKAFLIAFGTALTITGLLELYRFFRRKKKAETAIAP